MATGRIKRIVIIGAGNLGNHLGSIFFRKGIEILQVCNRTPESGKKLANATGAEYISDISRITKNADLYLLSVSDSAIEKLVKKIKLGDKLIVHCSGAFPMDILKTSSSSYGVFYPLQTFSLHKPVRYTMTPLCIEANSKRGEQLLVELGESISRNVHVVSGEQRRILHLAAVFANNFTNFMYAIAEDLLQEYRIPFSLLLPIIKQTTINVSRGTAFKHQTGPAIREDFKVMKKHIQLLRRYPEYHEIYELLSNNIIKYKKSHDKL
jgi:predicted short-subunit dehydrogenase-like oxidoreductase (DUF2520 family)